MKAPKTADVDENYIIALVGDIPGASVPTDDDSAAERQQKMDVLKESTRLERRDDPLELQRVKIAPRTPLTPSGTLYYFSRVLPITPEDKQVTFVTKGGSVGSEVQIHAAGDAVPRQLGVVTRKVEPPSGIEPETSRLQI